MTVSQTVSSDLFMHAMLFYWICSLEFGCSFFIISPLINDEYCLQKE